MVTKLNVLNSAARSTKWSLQDLRLNSVYLAALILVYLMNRIIFGEDYKLWSFTLQTFLQLPVTSSVKVFSLTDLN
jgi:hypothetical protein